MVHYLLGLARETGDVEDEEAVLAVHGFGGAASLAPSINSCHQWSRPGIMVMGVSVQRTTTSCTLGQAHPPVLHPQRA